MSDCTCSDVTGSSIAAFPLLSKPQETFGKRGKKNVRAGGWAGKLGNAVSWRPHGGCT